MVLSHNFNFFQNAQPSSKTKLADLKRNAEKAPNTDEVHEGKKPNLQQSTMSPGVWQNVSQNKINDLIENFIINDVQSLSVVESQSFIDLVTGLQPGKTVMTRKTLTGNFY